MLLTAAVIFLYYTFWTLLLVGCIDSSQYVFSVSLSLYSHSLTSLARYTPGFRQGNGHCASSLSSSSSGYLP